MQKKPAIPYGRQWISNRDIGEVVKVLRSRFITQGPAIERFEDAVASYCGVKHAVAFSSGTAALHGACFAADIKKGDEVITTPMTFAATSNCVLYCQGKPVFADIRSDLPLINPEEIKKNINRKTRAIIPVDFSGIPADYDEITALAKKNNLIVITDASHSLGATYKGKKVGQLADMTVISFHPVKAITTGEGGMVVTNNQKYYQRLQLFRTHGITKNPDLLQNKEVGPWYYEMQELGYNYRLTDIHSVLGISQLRRLKDYLKRRRQLATNYARTFKNFPQLSYLKIPPYRTSAWHIFPILLKGENLIMKKKQLVEKLHQAGIQVQVHYVPVHLHPFYQQKFKYKVGDFSQAEKFYAREISLPLYPQLTIKMQEKVISFLKQILAD